MLLLSPRGEIALQRATLRKNRRFLSRDGARFARHLLTGLAAFAPSLGCHSSGMQSDGSALRSNLRWRVFRAAFHFVCFTESIFFARAHSNECCCFYREMAKFQIMEPNDVGPHHNKVQRGRFRLAGVRRRDKYGGMKAISQPADNWRRPTRSALGQTPACATTIPKPMLRVYEAIVHLTDGVCDELLDAEYKALSRAMAAALCRKRQSPLVLGQPRSWACGIVYVLGRVNSPDDPSFSPYVKTAELAAALGVSEATIHAKARFIEKALGINARGPRWTARSRFEHNP
jgi:Domain of unknown function (DUF6398)